MNKARLTDRQRYYTKAKGLPLFKSFNIDDYVAWVREHEKVYLIKVNKNELKGIKDHKVFNDYLRIAADLECSKLQSS